MTESDEALEDIAAGLLNGMMVFLLGAALPAFFIWMAVNRGVDVTIGPDLDTFVAASQVVTLSIFSFLFMRWGLRTIWKNVSALRRRRRPASPLSE